MQLLTKPRKQKLQNTASNVGKLANTAITGGGTGALVGLLAKPKDGAFQRKAALVGAGLYTGVSATKSLLTRKKKNM